MKKLGAFSLIEVVVSGALVATTAGGLFALASLSTRVTTVNQDRLVASQLARQGIEALRQIRDVNFVSDACSATQPCADWRTGLLDLSTNASDLTALSQGRSLLKSLKTDSQKGFALTSVTGGTVACSDYLDRTTLAVFDTAPADLSTVYCRRIFIEPVSDQTITNSTLKESQSLLRVRVQIAWEGQGRTQLQSVTTGSLPAENSCATHTTEWCSEQVTLLANWRPIQ